jgi:hypothetical protein
MYQSVSRSWNSARGRGRGRGGSKPTNQSSPVQLPPARDYMQGLVRVAIGMFDPSTLCFVKNTDFPAQSINGISFEQQQENISIEDFQYIGSYNWTNRPGLIIVPGKRQLCDVADDIRKLSVSQVHPVCGRIFQSPSRRGMTWS